MYFFVDIRTGSSDNDPRLTQQMCNINMLLLWHRYCVDAFPYGTSLGGVTLGMHGVFLLELARGQHRSFEAGHTEV